MKSQALHGVVGGQPYIVSGDCTAPLSSLRSFVGTGPASTSANLPTSGNEKFNGLNSGFVTSVSLDSFGSGYVVGDVITFTGGTGTALQITVDMVDGSGAVVDYHVSRIGTYTAYPASPYYQTTTGGSGSGVQGYLNIPPPDCYVDASNLTSPVLWICTVGGTSSGSTWQIVSGASGGTQQFKIVSDGGDYWICNTWDGTTQGTVNVNIVKPYKLRVGNYTTDYVHSEVIRTVTYTYTYSGVYISGSSGPYAYFTRAVSGSDSSSETDYMTPDPVAGDIIYATPCTKPVPGIPTTVQSVELVNAGSGYSASQVLTLSTGTGTKATIKVLTVSSGAIATYQLLTGGNYTANPTLTACGVTVGSATFNVTMAPQLIDDNRDGRDWCK